MIPGLHDEEFDEILGNALQQYLTRTLGQIFCPIPHALRFDGEPCGRCGAQV
jgi:hypothetical protein